MCFPCRMCGACLAEQEEGAERVCPSCGKVVEPDALVCPDCFTFLGKPAEPSAQTPTTPIYVQKAKRERLEGGDVR